MEPNETLLPGDNSSSALAPGELIVLNGRQAGAARPLQAPLTLIGRAPGCDLRLNVEAVAVHHCIIASGPSGLYLRDLGSETGTLVNDQRISSHVLKDGDVLTVGPFQLRVRVQILELSGTQGAELDALRVQAAAVAAQQAALLEEENRLQQRRTALERQEEQLAAHLDQRRRELVGLKEQIRAQRAQLDEERDNYEQQRQAHLIGAQRAHKEAAGELARLKEDRQRLAELRRRLHRRWKRHWSEHERQLHKREREVVRITKRFTAERQQIDQARAEVHRLRHACNAERELTRRQLTEEWQKLQQTREQIDQRQQELEERARTVQKSREALEGWRQQAQMLRDQLTHEAEGLENRVRNLRQVVTQLEARRMEIIQPPAPSGQPSLSIIVDEQTQRWLARLEALTTELADQRLVLVEQWQRVLTAQEQWQAELLPELETMAKDLQTREDHLLRRQDELKAREDSLRHRQQALGQLRVELEAWRARKSTWESQWQQERESLLGQLEEVEQTSERRQQKLDELRKKWAVRRKQEVTVLQRELRRFREAQRVYLALREECERQAVDLGTQHRAVSERMHALEQLELERLGKSTDAVAAEKRLQKLRKQISQQYVEVKEHFAERERTLDQEAARQTSLAQATQKQLEEMTELQTVLAARQAEWEQQRLLAEESREDLDRQIEELRRQEQASTRRCLEMEQELNRLIALMLDEEGSQGRQSRAA